jgi:AraC family transcriptional activator of pobA
MPEAVLRLFDPRNGDLALRVEPLEAMDLAQPQRSNCFVICWVQQGSGTFWADLSHHPFQPGCLLFFIPYQRFRLLAEGPVRGLALQFHANFLCIETHHHEVGCNGVLFNDVYGTPVVQLDPAHEQEVGNLFTAIRSEMQDAGLAHAEVLVSYLKILLVKATRLKREQQQLRPAAPEPGRDVLDELRRLLERHYRTRHSPSDYADLLYLTPKALARLVKTHLHKTLTELIRERILKDAKWDLLHTLKPVKQIAAELGFDDVFYFSRLFKRATGCSPTFFREHETAIRGGSNLSMQ